MNMNKREFIKTLSIVSLGMAVSTKSFGKGTPKFPTSLSLDSGKDGFKLPELGFVYDALEPNIDAKTMEIHLTKHHAAYVKNLNEALKDSKLKGLILEDVLSSIKDSDAALRNNGGGHYNHTLFWKLLVPTKSRVPVGNLAKAIDAKFGSFDKFKELFSNEAKNRFGSGWAWLSLNKENQLFLSSTPNQDNPLMSQIVSQKGFPVLGLDVWEHAYYLKYQNKRADYINSFWEVLNWEVAEERYNKWLAKK
jgi:Fe-Mn family superoxide dismutase